MVGPIFRNMTLVALLLAAPGVAALSVDAPLAPFSENDLRDAPVAKAQDALGVVEAALTCQQAVEVPVAFIWGDITERRQHTTHVLEVREVSQVTQIIKLPIVETVMETVPGTSLFGLVEPATREVQRVTGYDVQEVLETQDLALDVAVTWQEQYWDYDGAITPVRLALPAGAGFLATGAGSIVDVCDGSVIHASMPEFANEGHDDWRVCIGCSSVQADRLDGWYVAVLGSRVVPAAADADLSEAFRGDGTSWCPFDVLQAADVAADRFAARVAGGERDEPLSPDVTTTVVDAPESEASASGTAGAVASSPLGAILASLAGVAAMVATIRRR